MTRRPSSFGSIRKLPSGKFQARYPLPGTETRVPAPMTFPTRRAAADWLAATRADMLRGDFLDPTAGAVTFGAYAAEHLANRVDLAPSTRELYRSLLARYAHATLQTPSGPPLQLAAVEVRALDLPLIRRWHAAVSLASSRTATARPAATRKGHPARLWAQSSGYPVAATGRLSPEVLAAWRGAGSPPPTPAPAVGYTGGPQTAQAYRMVRAICTAAVDDGLIRANPCRVPRAGHSAATERVPATIAELDTIAAAMPARLAAAVPLAAWSGLRAGELFALDRSRVDCEAGTVRVDRALAIVNGKVNGYGPPKTESSRRTVHLPPHVAEVLAEHMDNHTAAGPAALIFTATGGGPVAPASRSRAFARARAAAGRDDLRWHDLRHTGATLAAHAGASVRELQHRLGHSTVSAAMLYQHHSTKRDRELAARLSVLATAN